MDLMTDTTPDLATLEQKVDTGFTRIDGAFAVVDERFKRVDDRFDRVDERFKRVDDQFKRVDERFDEVGRRFDEISAELREDRARAEATSLRLHTEMKAGFERADDKFERLHILAIKIGVGLIGTLLAAIGTVIATHL